MQLACFQMAKQDEIREQFRKGALLPFFVRNGDL